MTGVDNIWRQLQSGDSSKALKRLELNARRLSPSDVLSYTGALLWCEKFEEARTVLVKAKRAYGRSSLSAVDEQLGVCSWCIGEPRRAVEEWMAAGRASYGDANGANIGPLLLQMAGIKLAGITELTDSVHDVAKLKSAAINVSDPLWPEQLLIFMVDGNRVDVANESEDSMLVEWMYSFYSAIRRRSVNTCRRDVASLWRQKAFALLSPSEFEDLVRVEEIHIARCTAVTVYRPSAHILKDVGFIVANGGARSITSG